MLNDLDLVNYLVKNGSLDYRGRKGNYKIKIIDTIEEANKAFRIYFEIGMKHNPFEMQINLTADELFQSFTALSPHVVNSGLSLIVYDLETGEFVSLLLAWDIVGSEGVQSAADSLYMLRATNAFFDKIGEDLTGSFKF